MIKLVFTGLQGHAFGDGKDLYPERAFLLLVCVVLASEGYPVSYEKGYPITGFDAFDNENFFCFHAGTAVKDGTIVTNGGRVLGVTAKGASLQEARKEAYRATEWISFENKYMRHDIGKAIDEA